MRKHTMFKIIKYIFWIFVTTMYLFIFAIFFSVGIFLWAGFYAEGIMTKYEDAFLGKDFFPLQEKLGKPNYFEKRTHSGGGGYYYYCPWPSFIKIGPGLKIGVDKDNVITSYRDPMY